MKFHRCVCHNADFAAPVGVPKLPHSLYRCSVVVACPLREFAPADLLAACVACCMMSFCVVPSAGQVELHRCGVLDGKEPVCRRGPHP